MWDGTPEPRSGSAAGVTAGSAAGDHVPALGRGHGQASDAELQAAMRRFSSAIAESRQEQLLAKIAVLKYKKRKLLEDIEAMAAASDLP